MARRTGEAPGFRDRILGLERIPARGLLSGPRKRAGRLKRTG